MREAIPAASLSARSPLGGAPPATRGERVHPLAEQDEERGQDGQRDQARERRDQAAGDPHRAQEPEREEGERRDRSRDGHRAEGDGPARRRDRPPDGIGARPEPRELLAVAGDEEQAVVDPEPEPDPGDDVQGVGRHGHREVENAQHEQPTQDRQCAADERQKPGDQAAKDPERRGGTAAGTRAPRRTSGRAAPGG